MDEWIVMDRDTKRQHLDMSFEEFNILSGGGRLDWRETEEDRPEGGGGGGSFESSEGVCLVVTGMGMDDSSGWSIGMFCSLRGVASFPEEENRECIELFI